MSAISAPCGWEPIPCGCDLPGYGPDAESGAEPDLPTQYAVETASYVLWALSGRQFGCCELTLRPCRRDCQPGLGDGPWGARLVGGEWINLPCRSCAGTCACRDISEIRLPYAPACSVTEVIWDGETLDADQYRLEDSEWVVFSPDLGFLPYCQDMWTRLGEEGTYGITYDYGTPLPVAGQRAVGSLACEILKACRGGTCNLPKRTRQIVADGISVDVIDPFEFFEKKRTGIYEVDLFLVASNPDSRSRAARVMSPDSAPRTRQVW